MITDRSVISQHYKCRITGYVLRAAIAMRAGVVKVETLADADEAWHLCREVRTSVETGERLGIIFCCQRQHVRVRHRFDSRVYIICDPRHAELRVCSLSGGGRSMPRTSGDGENVKRQSAHRRKDCTVQRWTMSVTDGGGLPCAPVMRTPSDIMRV